MKNITVTVLMFASLGILTATGCTTAPIVEDGSPTAVTQWESRAQITDRETQKSQSVSMDFVAAGRTRLRMEVSGAFATTVAVAVLDRDRLTYLLPRQKRYFHGLASSRSLRPVFHFDLEPEQIYRILYDEPMQGGAWTCLKTAEGLTASCENLESRMKISWLRREKYKKAIQIVGPKFDVQLNLERVPTKVQDTAKVFTLNIPQGFQNGPVEPL